MATTRATSGRPETSLPRANLLAERQGTLAARRADLRRVVARLIALVAVGVGLTAGLVTAHGRVIDLASSARRKSAAIAHDNARLAAAERAGKAHQARAQFLSATSARHRRWTDVMAVTGQVMPREIWLRRLVVKESEGRQVLLVDGYCTGLDVLPDFMRTLGRAVGAEETHIEQVSDARLDGRRVVRFASKVVLRPVDAAKSKREANDE